MPLDPSVLLNWKFDDVICEYSSRDAIIYALGIGLGRDPMDRQQLQYVFEKDLKILPTYAVTLASLGMWVQDPEAGITVNKLVHSGQNAEFYTPLPASAGILGKAKISEVYDRGVEKGAIIVVERDIFNAEQGTHYCKLRQTLMLRADGGFDGTRPPKISDPIPDRLADSKIQFKTEPGQAILYRLSGDLNPLHIDPATAQDAGFSQPILHGYCTYGIAGWAASQARQSSPEKLKSLECLFTGPLIPGEILTFEIWHLDKASVGFQAKVGDRPVLGKGKASFNV